MAHHEYWHNDNFNILTARRDKKQNLIFTGEALQGIEVGDTINYPYGRINVICQVAELTERRDAKAYPKGNGYYYEALCTPFEMDSSFREYQAPKEEEKPTTKTKRL
jgi:hypothetical protein